MEIGIDSFVALAPDPITGKLRGAPERIRDLLEEIERADQAGVDVFGIGEHHRKEFADSAPAMLLAAAAARTRRIRLASAVTVLSAADPVRVFQEFATLDLVSGGRAEIIAGRGSFIDAFPLFGLNLVDYDSLFAEKLELLLKLRESESVTWHGKHRPQLKNAGVYPRPVQNPLPIWVGVGGTPASFARAGALGLPLMIAIIGGEPKRFRPLVDLYRESASTAGHDPASLKVGIHALGYLAETNNQAANEFYPGYARTFTNIGRERGWGPVTGRQFEVLLGPDGALLVGDVKTVAQKIARFDQQLGGIDRLTLQMSVADLSHERTLNAIELIGHELIPGIRGPEKLKAL